MGRYVKEWEERTGGKYFGCTKEEDLDRENAFLKDEVEQYKMKAYAYNSLKNKIGKFLDELERGAYDKVMQKYCEEKHIHENELLDDILNSMD